MKSWILIFCFTVLAQAEVVIDLAGKVSNFTCFKDQGYSQAIVRAYHSYGAIDLDAVENIKNSNKAGLATDLYMFPCRGKDPALQVTQLLSYLDGMKDNASAFTYQTGTIWLDIETNPSAGCSWSQGTFDTNCDFIKALISNLKAKGRSVGIYASHYMWLQILGATDRCNAFMDLPIWYAHYDHVQDFSDWESSKFGGWAQPTLKQFTGSATVCGHDVDLSFY